MGRRRFDNDIGVEGGLKPGERDALLMPPRAR
jgi:hypothetical protein